MCLVSCAPAPVTSEREVDVGDGGFLSGDPCGPPCFWGIVPGETTEAELMKVLESKGILATCETYNHEERGGLRGINCGSRIFIGFEHDSEVVRGVGFIPSAALTVEDVIARYGEPDGVLVFPRGVHVVDIVVMLVYLDMLTWVELPEQRGEEGYVLEASTPVETIKYNIHFGDSPDNIFWRTWKGYGEY